MESAIYFQSHLIHIKRGLITTLSLWRAGKVVKSRSLTVILIQLALLKATRQPGKPIIDSGAK